MAKKGKVNPTSVADAIRKGLGDERFTVESRLAAEYRTAPEGFFRWAEDFAYTLDKATNKWVPFRFEPWQKDELRKILGSRFLTVLFCWPRRHGKSFIAALYDIWRALNFDFQNIVIGSNSEQQTLSTAYEHAEKILRNSPKLKVMVDAKEIEILANIISFRRTGSTITGIPTSEASAYGQGMSVAHITELCKARSDALYQVVASSTGDTHMGITIVDSNVGSVDNKVWELIQLAESGEDPTIGVSYVHYKDVEDAARRGPRWLDEKWLRSRQAQMTPSEFRRNHLNLPAHVGEKVFTEAQIDAVFELAPKGWDGAAEKLELPTCALPAVFSREAFEALRDRCAVYGCLATYGGLDRAMPMRRAKGDRTFWAVVAKLLQEESAGEIEIYDDDGNLTGLEAPDPYAYVLLDLVEFPMSNASGIQRVIEADRERYGEFANVSFEQYQCGDLKVWADTQGIPAVLTHYTGPVQLEAYTEFYRIIASGRFHASPAHWLLRAEFLNVEEDDSTGLSRFGGPRCTAKDPEGRSVRIKDDSVDAVINAIIAARGELELPQGPPASRSGARRGIGGQAFLPDSNPGESRFEATRVMSWQK